MNKNQTYLTNNSSYIVYIDILKIISSLAVVFIHVISILWYSLDPNSKNWNYLNIFDTFSRWCVPCFIMITGLLLLDENRNINIKKIFNKYIKKILFILIFWLIIYSIINMWNNESFSLKNFFINLIYEHYHLWYLYVLIGLYLITPILRTFITKENKKIIEYFLILWFIYNFIHYLSLLPHMQLLSTLISKFDFNFILGYTGYFILGFYLNNFEIKKFFKYAIYLLGLLSALCIFFTTKFFIINYPDLKQISYDYLSIFVCIFSTSIFILIKQIFTNIKINQKYHKILHTLNIRTFGIYLIHPIFIILINKYKIDISNYNTLFSIPITTLLIYLLSFLFTTIISKIPLINKWVI